jgi:hypothetical protein
MDPERTVSSVGIELLRDPESKLAAGIESLRDTERSLPSVGIEPLRDPESKLAPMEQINNRQAKHQIIILCDKQYDFLLCEYVAALEIYFNATVIKYVFDKVRLKLDPNCVYINLQYPSHFFLENSVETNSKIAIINIEQLRTNAFAAYKNFGFKCFTYAPHDINDQDKFAGYLPYVTYKVETDRLRSYFDHYEYDIVYVWENSDYRMAIITELEKLGYKIKKIPSFFENRDKEISKAKILLNVHYLPSYELHEAIRCDRWIAAGKLVVSQESRPGSYFGMDKFMHVAPYEKIVDKVIDVLKHFPMYQVDLEEKLYADLDNINNKKKKHLDDVIKIMLSSIKSPEDKLPSGSRGDSILSEDKLPSGSRGDSILSEDKLPPGSLTQ